MSSMTTAIHEAGHAWAYQRFGLPLRYVTIRPREKGVDGRCTPWRPRRIPAWMAAEIAAAGPIAEAVHTSRAERAHVDDFHLYLTGAIFAGGREDEQKVGDRFESAQFVDFMRFMVELNWHRIETVAAMLMERGTVSGRDAFDELSPSPRRGRSVGRADEDRQPPQPETTASIDIYPAGVLAAVAQLETTIRERQAEGNESS